jgi:hypothetical protein
VISARAAGVRARGASSQSRRCTPLGAGRHRLERPQHHLSAGGATRRREPRHFSKQSQPLSHSVHLADRERLAAITCRSCAGQWIPLHRLDAPRRVDPLGPHWCSPPRDQVRPPTAFAPPHPRGGAGSAVGLRTRRANRVTLLMKPGALLALGRVRARPNQALLMRDSGEGDARQACGALLALVTARPQEALTKPGADAIDRHTLAVGHVSNRALRAFS